MRIRTREENFWAKIARDPAADQSMEPLTAEEYMMNQVAVNANPAPSLEDAGKSVVVNASGTGYELGSGGSSLPPYTSSDKDKVLGLAEGTVEVAVVPEQTATISAGTTSTTLDAPLAEAAPDEIGYYLSAVGGSEEISGTARNNGSNEYTLGDSPFSLKINRDGEWGLYIDEAEAEDLSVKVRATVTQASGSVSPAWVQQGGGGIPVYEFTDFPKRTETISGQSFDSWSDNLTVNLGGQDDVLYAGNYVFVEDLDNISIPFIYTMDNPNDAVYMLMPNEFKTDTTGSASGSFSLASGVNVKYGVVYGDTSTLVVFIPANATIEINVT